MTISGGMVWDVRNGGADTNGGGFRGGSALSTPSAPSVAISAGGAVANATYYVVVTETDGNGETSQSAESSVVSSGSNHTITVTAPTNPSSAGSRWNVYFGTASGGPYFAGTAGTGLLFTANYAITATPPTSGTQAPGTDRSQQTGAQVVIDNAAITCTTTGANSNTLTFTLGYTPTAADVGNTVRLTAGTNITVGTYEITGWSSTTWTLTGAANATGAGGAGSAVTGNMGGGLATPGMAFASAVAGNIVYVKYHATAYSCSSSANVAGGKVSDSGQKLIGYSTTRTVYNLDTSRPTLNAANNSIVVVDVGNATTSLVRNLIVSGNAKTGVTGIQTTQYESSADLCKVTACATGFSANLTSWLTDCQADACTTTAFSLVGTGSHAVYCVVTALNGSATGFSVTGNGCLLDHCLAVGDGTGGPTGFNFTQPTRLLHCIAYGLGTGGNGNGFTGFSTNEPAEARNCIAYGCSGTGFNSSAPGLSNRLRNCAAGNNGTNTSTLLKAEQLVGFITLSASPFTNAAGNDFSLNGTAGGGALLKALGYPTSFPGLSTSTAPDVGAAQGNATSTDPGIANVKSGTAYTINGSALTGTLATGGGAPVIGSPVVRGLGRVA